VSEFISEDDLNTWEGFLRYQGVDPATAAPDVLAQFREAFDEAMAKRLTTSPMGEIFKPKPEGAKPCEFKYAVAVRDGAELLLTMTVSRDHKGDVYVIYPRQEDKTIRTRAIIVTGCFTTRVVILS
jgi:hypothetical protein